MVPRNRTAPTTVDGAVPKTNQVISLVDADPGLFTGIPDEQLELVRRHAFATGRSFRPGPLTLSPDNGDDGQVLGLLLLDGLALREVEIAGRQTAELLGRGDMVRPWDEHGVDPLPGRIGWTVIAPLQVAVLDGRFAAVTGRWPQVEELLLRRIYSRLRLLAMQRALAQIPRVDARVLSLLWLLADRWGHVSPLGISVPVPLTHETIAKLVGARRPSVTTGLGILARRGLIERVADGWLLHEDPRSALPEML